MNKQEKEARRIKGQKSKRRANHNALRENCTYHCMVKGCLRDHSLPIVMLDPDSVYEKHIKTFSGWPNFK
jgi:hypothetical protein